MIKKKFICITLFATLIISSVSFLGVKEAKAELFRNIFTYDAGSQASYVISAYPSSNYNASNYVRYGYSSTTGSNTWAYLKFNINVLPANATLTRATLYLSPYECSGTSSPDMMSVGRVTSDWSETSITWNNKPSSTSSVSGNHACDRQQHSADVTGMVNAWRSGTPNYGFVVYGPKNGAWHRTTSTTEAVKIYLQLAYEIPEEPAAPPIQAPPPSSSPVTSPSPDGGSGTGTSAPSASPSKPASEANVPVDTSIPVPVLTSVRKNGKELTATYKDSALMINQEDSLELFGTSFANAKVVVILGDIAFETTAGADGKWSIVLDNKKIKTGDYQVQAQAQRDGKGSEKVNLFKLKRVEKEVTTATKSEKKKDSRPFIILGITGAALLLTLVAGFLLNLKYHWINKVKSKLTKKPPEKKKN